MIYSKLFKSIIAIVMVLSATLFVGCSKENNDDGGKYADSPIVGKWSTVFQDDTGVSWRETYTFKANGQFVVEYKSSDGEEDGFSGTYTYEEPILRLYYGSSDELILEATVTISDNKLTLTNVFDGLSETYYRE